MCSAESPGPQVVCGKLAGNLAAGANSLHLSSLAIAFSFLLFSNRFSWQTYSPGRRQRRLGQPARSTRWLGFTAMVGVAQTGLSPPYLSLCSLRSNGTWHEGFPDPGSFWVAYWGDDFHFAFTEVTKPIFSQHQHGIFLFVLSQPKCFVKNKIPCTIFLTYFSSFIKANERSKFVSLQLKTSQCNDPTFPVQYVC